MKHATSIILAVCMQVHRSIKHLPAFKNAVITIGTFDGVHEGHKKIINELISAATAISGEAIIITFDPHPRKIVQPDKPLQLINTLEERIELLHKTGIHHLVIVPFTPAFAALSADAYITDFLVATFQPSVIIIGYDHHFGKDRKGNFSLLKSQSVSNGYRLLEIPEHVLNAAAVSSTKIRDAILSGDTNTANTLLGYHFFFEGVVVKGDQLGRQLGYPTANIEITDRDKIRLGHGVYAVYVECHDKKYKGMLSIGNRPTLTRSDEKLEVNIFDFSEDIYDQKLRIIIKHYLRAQEKYESLDLLIQQLHLDKINSLNIL